MQAIGTGGAATVYKAIDSHTDKIVALKVLHENYANSYNEKKLRRFHREVEVTCKLDHPGIVDILDAGIENERPYIVMEYIVGGSLREFSDKHHILSLDEVLKLLEGIADALDYAHQHNVIHRDLKLANILLNEHHAPVISDFGIALVRNMPRLTTTGNLMGSLRYAAPEILLRKRRELDYRSDLYALGVAVFKLLTGQFPFEAPLIFDLMVNICKEIPPDPCTLNPDLPQHIEIALLKSLAKDPDNRYQTAHEFYRALQDAFYQSQTCQTPTFIDTQILELIESSAEATETNQTTSSQDSTINISTDDHSKQKPGTKKAGLNSVKHHSITTTSMMIIITLITICFFLSAQGLIPIFSGDSARSDVPSSQTDNVNNDIQSTISDDVCLLNTSC